MCVWLSSSSSGRRKARARSSAIASCKPSCRRYGRLAELEETLKSARDALDAARDRRGEMSAAQARVHSDVQHMAETCVQELSVQRERTCGATNRSPPGRRRIDQRRQCLSRDAHAPGEHGPGEHDGAGRVQGDGAASRVPGDAAPGSAAVDREHAEHNQGDRLDLAAEVRRSVQRY